MAISLDGFLWVTDYTNKRIHKYTTDLEYLDIAIDIASEVSKPYGISFATDGSFFIACSSNDRIYKYTSDGIYTGFNFDVSNEDSVPYGLCVDDDGFIWMAGYLSYRVYKYTIEGIYTGFSISMSRRSFGVTKTSHNTLLIADEDNVLEYTTDGVYLGVKFSFADPRGICIDNTDDSLFITSGNNYRIYKYTSKSKNLPDLTAKDPRIPYKIVADLTA